MRPVAGLYDAAEARDFKRGLERTGFGDDLSRADMEAIGFFGCTDDLEDELIHALGPTAVLPGSSRSRASWRRCAGSRSNRRNRAGRSRNSCTASWAHASGRKIRYGRLLVEALNLGQVPRPLDSVLDALPT